MSKKSDESNIKYGFIGPNKEKEENLKKYYIIFAPNKRFLSAFFAIIFIVLVIAILNFPFGSFMSGNIGLTIGVGWPMMFLEFKMSGDDANFFIGNLIVDIILYVILAYLLNVLANFIMEISIFKQGVSPNQRPVIFKNRTQKSSPEKLAEKVVEKMEERNEEKEAEEKMFAEEKPKKEKKILQQVPQGNANENNNQKNTTPGKTINN